MAPKLYALLSASRRDVLIASNIPPSRDTRATSSTTSRILYRFNVRLFLCSSFFFFFFLPFRFTLLAFSSTGSKVPFEKDSIAVGRLEASSSFPLERIIPNKREVSRVGGLICARLKLFRAIRFPFKLELPRRLSTLPFPLQLQDWIFLREQPPLRLLPSPPGQTPLPEIFHLIRRFVVRSSNAYEVSRFLKGDQLRVTFAFYYQRRS